YAWVARKFHPSCRRGTLSFQHHLEVAALPENEREVWLDRAERFKWSKSTLRGYIRASMEGGADDLSRVDEAVLTLKVNSDRKDQWKNAAVRSGCDLTDWIITILDRASISDAQLSLLSVQLNARIPANCSE